MTLPVENHFSWTVTKLPLINLEDSTYDMSCECIKIDFGLFSLCFNNMQREKVNKQIFEVTNILNGKKHFFQGSLKGIKS